MLSLIYIKDGNARFIKKSKWFTLQNNINDICIERSYFEGRMLIQKQEKQS